jgi:protein O-GlcNAc transferase
MAGPSENLERALGLHRAGKLDEADKLYRAFLRSQPGNADALHLLGVLTQQRGDAPGGEKLIRQALARNPAQPMFHNNLGKVLGEQAKWEEAAASHRRATDLAPAYAEAQFNLGVALAALNRDAEAEAAYRAAMKLAPHDAKPLNNLGSLLKKAGRLDEAVAMLRQALALDPVHAEALTNLAYLSMMLGDFAGARDLYRRAIAARPTDPYPFRNYLTMLLYDPGVDAATRFAEHRRFAQIYGPPEKPERTMPTSHDADRPLRVGWLSADLSNHPVARNLEPLFAARDRKRFAAIVYADVAQPDAVTQRFHRMADEWRDIGGWTDRQVAERMRADRLDILISLAGRFDRNRPLVAAHRAAPVQISFHDPATSGLAEMDYLIADRILAPKHGKEPFTERVLRLPQFYIHAPLRDAPPVAPLPARACGHVTFGCFNNPVKINDDVLSLWADLLQSVPDSRLVLKYLNLYQSPSLRDRVQRVFAARGIEPARIEMGGRQESTSSHLAGYAQIDIALDPFPFSGSTTTFEALWMGVPVVTLLGDAMVGRWSASMLHAVGQDEHVARDRADYVGITTALASDMPRLDEIRRTLRDRVAGSPLCDGARIARHFERLLRAVWRKACA